MTSIGSQTGVSQGEPGSLSRAGPSCSPGLQSVEQGRLWLKRRSWKLDGLQDVAFEFPKPIPTAQFIRWERGSVAFNGTAELPDSRPERSPLGGAGSLDAAR